jgi:hypothetical protein
MATSLLDSIMGPMKMPKTINRTKLLPYQGFLQNKPIAPWIPPRPAQYQGFLQNKPIAPWIPPRPAQFGDRGQAINAGSSGLRTFNQVQGIEPEQVPIPGGPSLEASLGGFGQNNPFAGKPLTIPSLQTSLGVPSPIPTGWRGATNNSGAAFPLDMNGMPLRQGMLPVHPNAAQPQRFIQPTANDRALAAGMNAPRPQQQGTSGWQPPSAGQRITDAATQRMFAANPALSGTAGGVPNPFFQGAPDPFRVIPQGGMAPGVSDVPSRPFQPGPNIGGPDTAAGRAFNFGGDMARSRLDLAAALQGRRDQAGQLLQQTPMSNRAPATYQSGGGYDQWKADTLANRDAALAGQATGAVQPWQGPFRSPGGRVASVIPGQEGKPALSTLQAALAGAGGTTPDLFAKHMAKVKEMNGVGQYAPMAERILRVGANAAGQPISAGQARFQALTNQGKAPEDAASWAIAGLPPQLAPEVVNQQLMASVLGTMMSGGNLAGGGMNPAAMAGTARELVDALRGKPRDPNAPPQPPVDKVTGQPLLPPGLSVLMANATPGDIADLNRALIPNWTGEPDAPTIVRILKQNKVPDDKISEFLRGMTTKGTATKRSIANPHGSMFGGGIIPFLPSNY